MKKNTILTTLCYIEKDGKYLMLHRVKKKNDINRDKWIGVGGKLEQDESPEECLVREAYEETGLTLTGYRMRGVITFVSDRYDTEQMFLYTSQEFDGEVKECDEGELVWIDKNDIMSLSLWEGDKIFLKLLMEDSPFFTLKLRYEGDILVESKLGG